MAKKNKKEFELIVNDILNNQEFNKLDTELHHGISRYDHALRVAKATYYCGKKLRLKNIEETTRAALLHDFYTDDQLNDEKPKDRLYLHPKKAYENAVQHYDLTPLQANIIKSHMFPLKGELPKYKESWLVSGVDKAVAIYEMNRFKASLAFNVWILFIFNIFIQK